jgi:hypothetical protein
MGWLTEDRIDRLFDFIGAWSKPVAVWAIIIAVLYFGGGMIWGF